MVSIEEQKARLAVLLAEGMGRQSFIQLMTQARGSAQTLLSVGMREWRHWGASEQAIQALTNPAWAVAEAQLSWQEKHATHRLLFWDSADYPKQLDSISDAPPVLWVRGQVSCLHEPQLAMVGSRNATRAGLSTAFEFAKDLVHDGLTVTSGLAGGIDTASHEGALAQASGTTVAVMGTGIDMMYPARNKDLALSIVDKGAIVSEFPLGSRAQNWHFPQRNRIISGLSLGVLVVEATESSGSLITARLALEQGREVFAIPGSIHNPLAKGCHALIKRGQAKLIETVSDMLTELAPQLQRFLLPTSAETETHQSLNDFPLSDQAKQLLTHLPFEPMLMDDLIAVSGFLPAQVSSLLLELEMSGSVNLYGGAKVSRLR